MNWYIEMPMWETESWVSFSWCLEEIQLATENAANGCTPRWGSVPTIGPQRASGSVPPWLRSRSTMWGLEESTAWYSQKKMLWVNLKCFPSSFSLSLSLTRQLWPQSRIKLYLRTKCYGRSFFMPVNHSSFNYAVTAIEHLSHELIENL